MRDGEERWSGGDGLLRPRLEMDGSLGNSAAMIGGHVTCAGQQASSDRIPSSKQASGRLRRDRGGEASHRELPPKHIQVDHCAWQLQIFTYTTTPPSASWINCTHLEILPKQY